MRYLIAFVLTCALTGFGCSDDDDNGTGGTGGTAGTGGTGGTAGAGGGAAPEITDISWAPVGVCNSGQSGDYEVLVTAMDPDGSTDDLTYDGSVQGCTGAIDAAASTINCPNAQPYTGSVFVEDLDGNPSAAVEFSVRICADSSCLTEPNDCTL